VKLNLCSPKRRFFFQDPLGLPANTRFAQGAKAAFLHLIPGGQRGGGGGKRALRTLKLFVWGRVRFMLPKTKIPEVEIGAQLSPGVQRAKEPRCPHFSQGAQRALEKNLRLVRRLPVLRRHHPRPIQRLRLRKHARHFFSGALFSFLGSASLLFLTVRKTLSPDEISRGFI
jgi:hypothetical protein